MTAAVVFCDLCGARLRGGGCPRCAPGTPPPAPVPAVSGAPPRRRARRVRNLLGHATALACAWFGVPLAVFMTAVGAVLGGIGGLVSGTIAGPGVLGQLDNILAWLIPLPISMGDLLPTAAVQLGGTVGALLGAAKGAAVMAFFFLVGPLVLLWEADPSWPAAAVLGQITTAFAIAAGYVFFCRFAEPARMRLGGARRPSRREAAWLEPMVAEAAHRMGIRPPRLMLSDDRVPNACAGIGCVVVNRGLLDYLDHDRAQVAAVIAHEVAHVAHGDAAAAAWNRGLAWPLYLVYELAWRAQAAATRWSFAVVLVRVLLWSVLVTIRGIVVPANARHWRRCEYAADAAAAAAGYGPGLHAALQRIGKGFDGARTGWDATMLASHPPTELRLERLESPGRAYPLAEAPARAADIADRPRLQKD